MTTIHRNGEKRKTKTKPPSESGGGFVREKSSPFRNLVRKGNTKKVKVNPNRLTNSTMCDILNVPQLEKEEYLCLQA